MKRLAAVRPPENHRSVILATLVALLMIGISVLLTDDQDLILGQESNYQWLSSRDTEIDGATSSTYTVQSSDNGKVIKVRVTFTDDAGNDESLTSMGTSAVVMGGL